MARFALSFKDPGKFSLGSFLFFPVSAFYLEAILKLFNPEHPFFSLSLFRILLFSFAAGLLSFLLLELIPHKKTSRILGGVLLALHIVITCTQYCCKSFFKTYFSVAYMGGMAGQVVGDFASTLIEVVLARIPFILLALLPLIVYILVRRRILPEARLKWKPRVILAVVIILLQLFGILLSVKSDDNAYYKHDFSANASIPRFGILNCLRLELQYAIFGMPEAELEIPTLPVITPSVSTPTPTPEVTADIRGEEEDPVATPEPTPIVYGYNEMDIDFESLIANETDSTLLSMHNYFSSITPTQQNEYTGLFKGKNLILLTAEAFSPYVIDKELTPTLYKLSTEGFVFNNFYQPHWTQSTTGGEFAVMTGICPTWINGNLSFRVSAYRDMPFALGWQFQKEGYTTLAFHNNAYDYYGRDQTHPNLGYDYYGCGNGLELQDVTIWPLSDLDMMQATTQQYIQAYVEDGTPFHTYYMTVSGHCNYGWSINAMSRKHRDIIEEKYPDASIPVQAYLACNLELEAALTYLMDELEKAGIADDTVICLAPDHYPYALAEGSTDYYNELTGLDDSELYTTRYRNTLILWSGDMEEPVVVDTPCSSIDIVPTLSNLFGLEYDSRLFSGRDILATNYDVSTPSTSMPLVVFVDLGAGQSWVSAAGVYEAATDTFTPFPGVTVSEDYVDIVSELAYAKYYYAKQLIQYDYYSVVLGTE